jgi:hypothetical protein
VDATLVDLNDVAYLYSAFVDAGDAGDVNCVPVDLNETGDAAQVGPLGGGQEELDATVAGPTRGIITAVGLGVVRHRLTLAHAAANHDRAGYLLVLAKPLDHRHCADLGQLLVAAFIAQRVGVADDEHLTHGALADHMGDLSQALGRVTADRRAAEVEQDVALQREANVVTLYGCTELDQNAARVCDRKPAGLTPVDLGDPFLVLNADVVTRSEGGSLCAR